MLDACHPASHLLQTKTAGRAAGTGRGALWGACAFVRSHVNLQEPPARVPAPVPGVSLSLSSSSPPSATS